MREKQKRKERRNRIFLIVGSTVAIIAIFSVVAIVLITANKPAGPGPKNMASDGIVFTGSDAGLTVVKTDAIPAHGKPTPTDTTRFGDKVELNIVTYVDYRCPFCNQFETTNGPTIQSLVEAGIASLEVHPISILDRVSLGSKYSTRAASAAACVANYQPDKFLDVQNALFGSQPEENTAGLTNDDLASIIAGAGADNDKVAACVKDERFTSWVTAASNRALADPDLLDEKGQFGTPRVLVNGVLYTGAVDDANAFQSFVAQAAVAAEGDGATPTPTPTPAG